uniref:Nodulin-like domain-containing protein n=1 Tax=Quercus lobata TaxID=97700 RepID=A0A7N2R9M9_QUELO
MDTHTTGTSCGRFVIQALRGQWFMMFASFLIMTRAGATYLFGVYSVDIKATLGYDQSTLNLLSTCKDLGANVGVLSGLLAEAIHNTLLVPLLSEIILLRWKVPRPLIMTLVLSGVGDLLIAFPIPSCVYIASLIIGFSYGAQLTLLFTIISELFGLKYYSTLFNCGQLASPLGSYVFNVQVVGKLYDKEALKQLALKGMTRSMVKELTCMGKECYRLSFVILAGTRNENNQKVLSTQQADRDIDYRFAIKKQIKEKKDAAITDR